MTAPRILLLDDDRDFVQAIATRCGHLGYHVETALNPLTAIQIITVRPPDLICLDVEMPTGDGLSICEFLSTSQAMRNTPVIIMTGRNDSETIRRCGSLKAHYVHKTPDLWQRLEPLIAELAPQEAAVAKC